MASRTRTGWRVYTEAARRTAVKQAPAALDDLDRRRARARRTAAATAVAAERRVRSSGIMARLGAAVRDVGLILGSVLVLWFVVTRTGVQIPITGVLAVVGVIAVVRIGYALIGRR